MQRVLAPPPYALTLSEGADSGHDEAQPPRTERVACQYIARLVR